MSRIWRVIVPDLPAREAIDGAVVEVLGDEAHHVVRVLRLRAGESLGLLDGRGRECVGTIQRVDPGIVEVCLEREVTSPVEAPLRLVLFQAIERADKLDWIVQKATEIGVAAVRCTATERGARSEIKPRRVDRLRRIALEACKQSGRRLAPDIDVHPALPEAPRDVTGILLEPRCGSAPLGTILSGDAPSEVWLAVGPESGFTADEVRTAAEKGWQTARIGPRVLRADTAGLVAATIVLHRWADLT